MTDILLVLHNFFDWRFLLILLVLCTAALTLPDSYTQPFRSVRFNVWLFLIIAIASAIGTFLPQNKPPEEALAKVGPLWAKIFSRVGFLDIYHSWWFSGLLALMAFDVIACKLRKLPKLIHGPINPVRVRNVESLKKMMADSKHTTAFEAGQRADRTAEVIRDWLRGKRLNFVESHVSGEAASAKGAVAFSTGRHRLQRWGDFILHVSIVVVLAGNLMGAMFGFEEMLPIKEGASVTMEHRPYVVTLKDFDIEYYKTSGAPSLYASELVVQHEGKVLGEKRVVVNQPLDINRVRFYQASWGMTNDFDFVILNLAKRDLLLRQNEVTKIPGTPLSVRANLFYPSFDIEPDGRVVTRDLEGKNPAVQFDFLQNGAVKGSVWLLQNQPGVAFRAAGAHAVPTTPPPFHLVDVSPILFSGIQVGYDPGAPLFWTGAIFLLIGLCMHFYMHQRRLRIVVLPRRGSKSEVHIGGWNSRTPQEFEKEFSKWVKEIQALLV